MAKIAISLPDDVLHAVEKERKESGISRSEFFRKAVEEHLRREHEKELEKQYVRGYLENPESPEEMEWILQAGLEALTELPWEDGDEE